MYFSKVLITSALLIALDTAFASPQRNNNNQNQGQNNNNGNGASTGQLALSPNALQSASNSDGSPSNGQAASQRDPANFINFCAGKVLTNGQQISGGSCNGIVMGDLPPQGSMVSSIILNPKPGDDIDANKQFTVSVQVANLQAGTFTNPQDTYYAAPQTLQNGKVVGHTHVTIQDLGSSLSPQQAPDASKFVFFKGIDDDGNGKGTLSVVVTNGLPAGNYRICTMSSSSNHQPVLMPVAQRGAQDDCTKFTVGQSQSSKNSNSNSKPKSSSSTDSGTNVRANSDQHTKSASSTKVNNPSTTTSASSTTRNNAQATNSTSIGGDSTSVARNSGMNDNKPSQNDQTGTPTSESTQAQPQASSQTQGHGHRHQNKGRALQFVG